MMAAATVDMNRTIISFNLNIIEEQRRQMYHTVNQYVDKVIDAGRRWTTRKERNQSNFLDIHKITSKAMAFLSLKCDEMKSELESETSHLIGRDEFTQQQKNAHAQMDSVTTFATMRGQGKEDDIDDVKKKHTSRNPNLERDQQSRYQVVYNQLKSVLTKQNELEQQQNIKLNNLREDTESLKLDVRAFNQYVETGKTLMKDYSQKLETLENTVSCLSEKGNEMYLDQQVLVDRINSHLSDKDDQVNTDLSAKVDQINLVLQTLTDSENEHAAQINKLIDLEKCFNTMEKDTQNNDKQVQQDELGAKLLDMSQKLIQLSVRFATKNDFGAVGFTAATTLPTNYSSRSVGMFEPPAFIAGCQFNPDSGIFTAFSQGIYLAYVNMCLDKDGYACFHLIHEHPEWYEYGVLWHGEKTHICSVRAQRKGSIMCSLGMIAMEEGHKLFIHNPEDYNVSCRIQFSCFRIG